MNAKQILDWISEYRPDWMQGPQWTWLQQQLQGGDQTVLDSVSRDIRNNEPNLQQVNTNIAYNVQQEAGQNQFAQNFGQSNIGQAMAAQTSLMPPAKPDGPPAAPTDLNQALQSWKPSLGGLLSGVHGGGFDLSKVNTSSLQKALQAMQPALRKQALALIQQQLSQASGLSGIFQNPQQVIDNLTDQVSQMTAQQPTTSTSLTPGAQDITQAQKDNYKLLTGQDFDTAYQNFAKAYGIAASYRDPTGRGGQDVQLWTTQQGGDTPSADTGWELNAQALTPAQQQSGKYRVSPAQFFAMQSQQSVQGGKINIATQIENLYAGNWATLYGGVMPEGRRTAIWNAISKMTTQQLFDMSHATGGVLSALAPGQGSVVDQAVQDWDASPEGQADIASNDPRIQAIESAYERITGQKMTSDQAKAYLGMPESDIQAKFNQMGDPRHKGFTYGSWDDARSRITSRWESNGLGTPTDAEIARYNGMSDTMIQDNIDLMPSNVAGVNRGMYQDYYNEFQNMEHALPGDLINSLLPDAHAHVTGATK